MSDVLAVGASMEEQRMVRRWTARTGWSYVRSWRGLDGDCAALISQLQALGVDVDVEDEEGPYAIVRGNFLGGEDGIVPAPEITTVWTRRSNVGEKSIYDHPTSVELGEAVLKEIQNQVDKSVSWAVAKAAVEAKATAEGVNQVTAVDLLRLATRNVEAYIETQYVLRKTQIVPKKANLVVQDTNVGKLLTTSTLNTLEQVPTNLLFTLPVGNWLKMPPEIDQRSDGKWEVVEEWWYAESPATYLYGAAL